jgi:hypothetical protein
MHSDKIKLRRFAMQLYFSGDKKFVSVSLLIILFAAIELEVKGDATLF